MLKQLQIKKDFLILLKYKPTFKLKQYSQKIQLWEVQNIFTKQKAWMKIQKGSRTADQKIFYQSVYINAMKGHLGFPVQIWSGRQNLYTLVLIQQLGDDLNSLLKSTPQHRFSLKTVCMIGIQLIKLIQDYHMSKNIHRNICPQTLHIGKRQKSHIIYLNNLQNSRKYINQQTGQHIKDNKKKQTKQILNAFKTANQLKNKSSRRDDIEAAIIMLIYFLKGRLPWQSILQQQCTQEIKKSSLILSITNNNQELFEGIPTQFKEMVLKTRLMEYQSQPIYMWYLSKLQSIMHRNNWQNDYIFDWVNTNRVKQKFKVNRSLPTFYLQNEDELLNQVYYPFQQQIQIEKLSKQKNELLNPQKNIESEKRIRDISNKSRQCIIM